MSSEEKFDMLMVPGQTSQKLTFCGIPFSLFNNGESFVNLSGGNYDFATDGNQIFFLGMVTDFPEGSDRWGMSDRFYSFQNRIFIGDRIGRILIKYKDGTQSNIPLLFGVNVWPYEMYSGTGPLDAKNIFKGGAIEAGPYCEPFESDADAALLLRKSLLLNEAGNFKNAKYIFALEGIEKSIKGIHILDDGNKKAGIVISAITSFNGDESNNDGEPNNGDESKQSFTINFTNINYFHFQNHIVPMRNLSKRLYQYKNEIPSEIPIVNETGRLSDFSNVSILFKGNSYADIFTNLLIVNYADMSENKIDNNGDVHTSSLDAPSFGRYVGFGTFKEKDGAYYEQIWSRDAGRMLIELIKLGESERTVKAADKFIEYLYDKNIKFDVPNWKRVINASSVATPPQMISWSSRENDGHGLIMLFIYDLIKHNYVIDDWVVSNWKHIEAAVYWYIWQIDTPEKSNFNGLLYSDSEPAGGGGYDLYSNYIAYAAIVAFSELSSQFGFSECNSKWKNYSNVLLSGIKSEFEINESERGFLYTDTYTGFDSWALGFKMFAPLFAISDFITYDVDFYDKEIFKRSLNTYKELLLDYKSSAYGRMMGYCQAFALQSAILLDVYEDITELSETTSMMCYHKYDHNYIVCEGVIMHPSNEHWFRNGDLGNSVQQAEIVKCARLMIGLDDLNTKRGLRIVPRMPDTWTQISVSKFPLMVCQEFGKQAKNSDVNFDYYRINGQNEYRIVFQTENRICFDYLRAGPFSMEIETFEVSDKAFDTISVKIYNNRKFIYIKPTKDFIGSFDINIRGLNKN